MVLIAVISSLFKGRGGSLFNFKIFETQDYLDHLPIQVVLSHTNRLTG